MTRDFETQECQWYGVKQIKNLLLRIRNSIKQDLRLLQKKKKKKEQSRKLSLNIDLEMI